MMRLTALLACLILVMGAPLAQTTTDAAKTDADVAKRKGSGMTAEQQAQANKRAKQRREAMPAEQKAWTTKHSDEKKTQRAAAQGDNTEKPAAKPATELPPPGIGPR
jgi:ABC-type protease/lipase transport system fused ATPase/permease subunit